MTDAFVNVETSEDSKRVAEDIGGIESVSESYAVKGQFDVLARVEGVEETDLPRIVTGVIHEVVGVEETRTLVVDD